MKREDRNRAARWFDRAVIGGVGLLAGVLLTANCKWSPASQADPAPAPSSAVERRLPPPPSPSPSGAGPLGTFESPFVAIAEQVLPSVVNVNTRKMFEHPPIPGRGEGSLEDLLPELRREELEIPSTASGFVYDPAGYIITNNHVIQNAEEVRVTFLGGAEFDAEVIGVDPSTDVAVLKIESDEPFPGVLLGDSDAIRVGDWAVAVGNPFGYLEGSVTVGVISAKGRADLDIAGGTPIYQNFIQTDASINFGNSGGPLVNIRGEVIGVNTAVNAAGQGIGFSIPINLARRVADQLIAGGRVVRAYLGVYPQELTPEIVEVKKLGSTGGILIGQVIPNAPSDRGGLERGDVIVSFGGVPVKDVAQFRMLVAESEVGGDVKVEYIRDGARKTARIRLVERPDVAGVTEPESKEEETWLGLRLIDPFEEPDAIRSLGIEGEPGLLVASVLPGSPAWDGGIRVGDLVQEIDNREIVEVADYLGIMRELADATDPILFLVYRGGFTRYLAVRP